MGESHQCIARSHGEEASRCHLPALSEGERAKRQDIQYYGLPSCHQVEQRHMIITADRTSCPLELRCDSRPLPGSAQRGIELCSSVFLRCHLRLSQLERRDTLFFRDGTLLALLAEHVA